MRRKVKITIKVKSYDYIDSSIFLGYAFEQGDACKEYLNTVGYKSHNKGVVSHFVMSEVLISLLIKIKLKDPLQESIAKEKAFKLLDETITRLLIENKLTILNLTARIIDTELLNELKEKDTKLTDDDALHLIETIKEKCQFFVTTDEKIIKNKGLREHLSNNYNLKIKEIKLG